ncbi:uncharacterized protein EAF02_005946 [Botrytis sinoallii]|uniref:uncharacterized protein n=1 Tax=Botrytis sinoallii TaxID=1463999 RepID=UPI0019012A56|nr:uncharacterized protein EAF02_005946 [Botrytis sinoallii]KAF7882583.1 hypothetical protein EAF02_005946 [Botrytis sinoallii]
MDPKILNLARKLQELIDSKHQYARTIDAATKQLIQLICQANPRSTNASAAPSAPPTRDAFQADLLSFAHFIFQQLSKPPPIDFEASFAKAMKPQNVYFRKAIDDATNHIIGNIGTSIGTMDQILAVVENIDHNIVGLENCI